MEGDQDGHKLRHVDRNVPRENITSYFYFFYSSPVLENHHYIS